MNEKLSMKTSAMINIGSKYIVVMIQLVYQAILARLLTPNDYGIVAVITVFVNFFAVIADLGVGNAIIQNQTLDEDDINSIFSWSVRISIGLAVIFCFLSIPISVIYSDNVYLILGPMLSLAVLFSALNMVPNALLLKKKKFLVIGIRQVVVCVACSIVAIVLALTGFGYYALVIYSILTALFNFLWNMRGSGLKLRVRYSRDSIGKVRSFSMYLLAYNVVNYFSRNIDNLVIGRVFGNEELGYYNKAYQLMLYPMNYLANVVTPVLLPFLAEFQDKVDYVYKQYIKTVKLLSLLGVYIAVFCFFSSYELISILYGSQWVGTVAYFQILSITIWSQMICATASSMFQVLDKTKLQFIRAVVLVGTIVVGVGIGAYVGSVTVIAFMIMLSYTSYFITMLYYLVKKSFHKSIWGFLKNLIPDAAIAVILSFVLYGIGCIGIENVFASFFVKLIVSAVVYFICLIVMKQFVYFEAVMPDSVKRIFQKLHI